MENLRYQILLRGIGPDGILREILDEAKYAASYGRALVAALVTEEDYDTLALGESPAAPAQPVQAGLRLLTPWGDVDVQWDSRIEPGNCILVEKKRSNQ